MIAIWRPRAERDLDGPVRYIAQFNVRAAVDLDLRVEHVISLLEANPHLGHLIADGKTREFRITATTKLIYRIRPRLNAIEIVRVIHSRQKYP